MMLTEPRSLALTRVRPSSRETLRTAALLKGDDIIIDMNTGSVRMKGPFTKEEKPAWDKLRARKKECDLAIADMRRLLEEMPNNRFILEDIQHEERLRNMISRVIPD